MLKPAPLRERMPMHADTFENVDTQSETSPSKAVNPRTAAAGAIDWLRVQLDRNSHLRLTRFQLLAISTVILLSAIGVRLLCWHDNQAEIALKGEWNPAIARHYQSEA